MIRKEKLSNGLALITESMPQVRSVSIGIWLARGSRHEPPRVNGISHFIEHLVFKGTRQRTAREIALAMDSVGGQVDAFTSKEYTCFYAKVLDEHVDEAVDLLADIVQRPLFDPTELERERQVVLEEIKMVEDTPDELIYDLFTEHFYPKQKLGRPIQGTVETVSAMSRRQLLNFFHSAYRPHNMLVAAAGNLRHAKLARVVRGSLGGLERGRVTKSPTVRPRPSSTTVVRSKRDLEQVHLLMGLPAFAENSPRRYPLYVLNTILGGAMSSRLFQRIREERGLAYSVYSTLNTYRDSGALMVYAATGAAGAREVVALTVEELRKLGRDGPTKDEMELAREHLKGSLMLSLESTASRMSSLARQEVYRGRQQSLADTLHAIERVTARQVHGLARRLFMGRRLSLAAVGPLRRFSMSDKALTP